MKRLRRFGWVLLALTSAALLLPCISWLRLPRFEGKTVRYWFDQGTEAWVNGFDDQKQRRAERAFKEMGPAAAPFLISELGASNRKLRRPFQQPPFPWNVLLKIKYPSSLAITIQSRLAQQHQILEQRTFVAIRFLEHLGPKLAPFKGLAQVLREAPDGEKFQILHLFWRMGPAGSNSVPVVASCFYDSNSAVRHDALSAFAEITPPGSPDLELLRKAVIEGRLRAAAGISVLDKLGGRYSDLLPLLGKELSSNSANKFEALMVTKRLKMDRTELVEPVSRALSDRDPRYRAAVLQTLQTFERARVQCVKAVAGLLEDDYYYVRAEAIRTLAMTGPAARKTLERIKRHENDPNEEVRAAAREARTRLE